MIFEISGLYNENHEPIEVANHPMEILFIDIDYPLEIHDMGRKVTL